MAERQELQVILRTIAEGAGAKQTSLALQDVRKEAAATSAQTANLARQSAGMAATAQSSARGMLAFAGGIGLATTATGMLTDVLGSSINAQREHERIARATAASYGAQAEEFTRFAAALSSQTGFASDAILEAALSARTLTANYGMTIEQTQELIRVSADLARIRGIGIAEAFERVQSAMRGEAEASEYLGLTLNDTYIKNNALNGSVKETFETMKDGEKAQIRYNELLKQTAQFQGLAASSADSLDGAFSKAEVSANKLQLELGRVTAPSIILGLKAAAQAMEDITRLALLLQQIPSSPVTVGTVPFVGPAAAIATEKIQQALAELTRQREQAQQPIDLTVNIDNGNGQSVTYEELIEAADQAGMPPVVRVSGVRR